MNKKKMSYFIALVLLAMLGFFGWKLTARNAYESAEYEVLTSERPFEVRQYPDLMMATTEMKFSSQGNDGSFMRLFRYISGGNDEKQKVAMTTPVFMEREAENRQGQIGFVMPKKVMQHGIPHPAEQGVQIEKRSGGRFAVIRFTGRAKGPDLASAEGRLRDWMQDQALVADSKAELAGYDPPWTPGPFRRNEILIRCK